MSFKTIVVLYCCAVYIQNIAAQCIGAGFNGAEALAWGAANNLAWEAGAPRAAVPYAGAGLDLFTGAGYSPAALSASNGGGLSITSASPIAPTGVAMTSENAYEGILAVNGALPFLAAVSLDGILPTAGSGAVMYSNGNGHIGMTSEDITPSSSAAGFSAGVLPYGGELGLGYNRIAGPLGFEGGIASPAYGYNTGLGLGCGCGALY